MAVICGFATAYPPHTVSQEEALGVIDQIYPRLASKKTLRDAVVNTRIQTRQAVRPAQWYTVQHSPAEQAAVYAVEARTLAAQAGREALKQAGLTEIDAIVTTSTTGALVPSLAACLIADIGLSADAVQMPLYGYGCAGGGLGLGRALELMRAGFKRVLFVTVELTTINVLHSDETPNGLIAASLFGDGAAALVLTTDGSGPQVQHARSVLLPKTERVMTWERVDDGMRVEFGLGLPPLLIDRLPGIVQDTLDRWGWTWDSVQHVISHTGGPKILRAIEEALAPLPGCGLSDSWDSLAEYGNTSSVSVLDVLGRTMQYAKGRSLLLTMGPGFNIGLVGLVL